MKRTLFPVLQAATKKAQTGFFSRSKKLLLTLLVVCFCSAQAVAQTYTTEFEPNNDIPNANQLDYADIMEGSIGNGDAADYHRLPMEWHASIYILFQFTNNGTEDADISLALYHPLPGSTALATKTITGIAPGDTYYDTIYVCGRAADNYYLEMLSSAGSLDYTVQWYPVNAATSRPDNNTRGTATAFNFGQLIEGGINYTMFDRPVFPNLGSNDRFEYFKTTVPNINLSGYKIHLKAQNNDCLPTGNIAVQLNYYIYKNNETVAFAEGLVGNTSGIGYLQTVMSEIPVDHLAPGDEITVYLQHLNAGAFKFEFVISDLIPFNDQEDNCCTYNAIHLDEDQTVGGNVGEFDETNYEYRDEYDTYRISLPYDGAINVYVAAQIATCGVEEPMLICDILDENGNELETYRELARWSGYPGCGDIKYDTVKIRAFQAGTYYLRLRSYAWGGYPIINYNLKYDFVDSTGGDIEPNNTEATATQILPGEVKKGHINFKKYADNRDNYDYYKAPLPQDGQLKVYVKAKHRGEDIDGDIIIWKQGQNDDGNTNELYTWEALQVTYLNTNQSKYVPSTETYDLFADSLYVDTLTFCPAAGGWAYIRLGSDRAYEYEIWYELTDTISWVGDVEPNNTLATATQINAGETKTGRLRYYQDRQGNSPDTWDHYKTTIPAPGMLKIYMEATNTSCDTPSPMELSLFTSTSEGSLIYSKNIGNGTNIPPGATVYDTILPCFFTGSALNFRLEATQTFRYKIRYEVLPMDTTEVEPDNTFATATPIGSGQNRSTFLGLKYNDQPDVNDYFKMVVPGPDTLRLHWQATNISCVDNRYYRIYGYNKNMQQIFFTGYIFNGVGTVDAGQTVADSLKVYVAGIDTVYIRFNADGLFKYNFQTNTVKPSSWFKITGDTTACEGGLYTYRVSNFVDSNVVFNWSLPLGGGVLNATDSIATVEWNANGNRSIRLTVTNSAGTSPAVTQNIIVNGVFPTQVPVASNFARTLSTGMLPPGAYCQWYRNDTLIVGATDSTYYAADAGSFTVKYVNDCGAGPASNAIVFGNAAEAQVITFPHVPTITMSPTAKAPLLATASSGLPVFYQKISGPATILNDTLYITGAGTIIVKAMQPGDDIFRPAIPVNDTITVVKGNQLITFDPIPDKVFSNTSFFVSASSSSGLGIVYSIVSGRATINSGGRIDMNGAGTVTVRAAQPGNANYNAATSVDRTFCIGVRTLTGITGEATPCLAEYRYNVQRIPGAIYTWSLSGGGVMTTNNNDTAWIQWQTPGTYTIKVKATSPCDPVFTNEQEFIVTTSANAPAQVTGMLPGDHATDQQLPLQLSWIPGSNTVTYDLYIWDSLAAQPVMPYAANLTTFAYTLPQNAPFQYNKTYKWRVISKNPCSQTSGPVQHFRLIPLPDLLVSDVQIPTNAVGGQTITVSWKVTNIGPGRTLTDQQWRDGVYFALDTVPHVSFQGSPNWNPTSWSSLTANGRPLLLGYKDRPAALEVGEFYTNSIDFTLPLGYNFPVYAYVIAANNHPNYPLLQASVANDTARAPHQMQITLPPVPDLRVDSVFAPSTVFSGSTINLTYKVKNYGSVTPAGGNWTDSIFISQSPLFDRSQSFPLKTIKANGSYYPNANDATVFNNTQLNAGEMITKNIQVVIPNFKFGTWFIYVKTNAREGAANSVYEGPLNNNNLNRCQLEIYLTPTPKLTVTNLSLPVTAASTSQTVGVNWKIKNEGFWDNIEKNRGHYITNGMCTVSCGPSAPANAVCTSPSVIKDSIVFGGSYWIDRVYLSTDPNGLNVANAVMVKETKHGVENSGFYADPYTDFVSCPALVIGNVNVNNVIKPESEFAKAEGFTIPSDLQPGNYYVYVYANPTKTVFEYPGTPQIQRSPMPIAVTRPDATISSLVVSAASFGGQTITINYSVLNNGPGAVFNHNRNDQLYISNFSNFDASAQLIGTNTFTENLPVGTSVPHAFTYTIPPATTGNKYFYVITNHDSLFKETNMLNNRSSSVMTTVSAAQPADLVVAAVQPVDSVFTIFSSPFKYTVNNNGSGATIGHWTDSLFISCSPVFSPATSYFIAKRFQQRTVQAGGNYTDSFTLTMPKMSYEISNCFPQQMHTTAYFFVKTNADTAAYETTGINNNVSAAATRVLVNPLVDLTITEATNAKDTLTVGIPFTASWKIKNIGYVPPQQYYYYYTDAVYFSSDSVMSTNDAVANTYLKYNGINRNETFTETKPVMPPNIVTGDYYVYVKTNYDGHIPAEKVLNNNGNFIRDASGAAKKIHVFRPLLPDLVDTIMQAPASVAVGQPITIIYKVTNTGVGATYPGGWKTDLRLSRDFFANPNDGDRLLSTRSRTIGLAPGQSYLDTVTVTIPSFTAPGNYILLSHANANNDIVESTTGNNLGFSLLNVYLPDSTDLIVSDVQHEDTVYLGYTMSNLKWVVQNTSAVDARGYVTDGVYLSAGNLLDSTAKLLGTRYRHIDLEPLETDTVSLAPLVTGVVEGNYNVFAKTDLLNNIIEENKENNEGVSVTPIYVKVKELPMNVNEANTLQSVNRYYKLLIPDSLRGSTIMVTLKTNDSLIVRNEMYMASGYVPTQSQYQYRFENANYGNQQIVMPDVTDSVYYIMYRCVSPNPPLQQVTLKAVKLPFAILNVHTNAGGNIGNVTIRIRGSLFRDSMMAKLTMGSTTIYASAVYYTNTTQVFATFNLQGKPLGVYDVSLLKPDNSEAILPASFSVVKGDNGGLITGGGPNTGAGNGNEPGCDPGAASGLNAQLVVEMVVPDRVLIKRPVVIQIHYSNPTNYDIPAQSRILYSEYGVKMALTKEGVANGTTQLYLDIKESDGPPGILRAGSSGTITVYCNAPDSVPQPGGYVLFKLK